jgi:hypothetical protein
MSASKRSHLVVASYRVDDDPQKWLSSWEEQMNNTDRGISRRHFSKVDRL